MECYGRGTGTGLGMWGRVFDTPWPTPSPRMGPSPPWIGSSFLPFHLTGLVPFNQTSGAPLASERQLSWPHSLYRPALVRCLESFHCSSFIKSSLLHRGEHTGCYHILNFIDLLCDSQEIGVPGPYKGPHTRVLWELSQLVPVGVLRSASDALYTT